MIDAPCSTTPLQSYFTDHAHAQKGLSPNTVASYRDTWRLLIKHLSATTALPADKLDLGMLDVEAITAFLDHLETDRGNTPGTYAPPADVLAFLDSL